MVVGAAPPLTAPGVEGEKRGLDSGFRGLMMDVPGYISSEML